MGLSSTAPQLFLKKVDGGVTSFVNLSIASCFPLIRATRWRLFSASSNRFLRTNHRADSEYHLGKPESRLISAICAITEQRILKTIFDSHHWPAVGKEQEVRCTDNHLQLPPVSEPIGKPCQDHLTKCEKEGGECAHQRPLSRRDPLHLWGHVSEEQR